ncbi:pentatricopeptide repeat-containing protein At5g02830, chloroplastic isoform X1 [Pistacia vera]|uniref:pentatricopeptide repeat-containing protein At5g02830, chloroplastic isoform X1 n=1 Tax=Pistacia vera TaxID=55513 RepID=UPI0012630BCF|nr:pentatricopeptide repeat-containing protein At5g02830, chloroplastic isoform X1 [Pistacia vera]
MRLILGTTTTTSSTSSSSSIVAPPPHQAHHGHRNGPKPKPKSKPTPSSKHYIAKLSPSATPAPAPPTVHSSHAPLLSSLRWDYTSQLKYHADLASKLAEDGRLEEFVMILESVVVSGGSGSKFVSLLSFELVSRGIVRSLLDGRVHCVVEVLKKVEKLGIAPLKLFDGNSFQYLKKECKKIVDCGELEKFVDLIDTLAGFRIPIKELGDSYRIVKFCVDKRDTNLAIRYASILPHAHILFCTIIHEFGKKRDLVSALTVYEASKKNLIGPNMYICRTIIDVCGLCCDYMQSRSIYEDLLSQKIAPNIYVFNSVMNVNAHDLNFTLQVYKNMQEFGVMADMTSYNILLKACCLAGRVDLAQEIYREVMHLESKGVLKLDVFTYSTIVKVFADAKLWLLALQIKEDMLSAGVTPNTVTWSSLINACANAGLVEQALCLFDEMLLAGCEPNSQCCNILLQACVEACQYDRAFRLFWSWKQSSARQTFCEDSNGDNSILSTETKHNYFVTSTQSVVSNPHHLSFSKRFPFKPTTTTYNILMKACGTDYYHAKALMDEMRTAGLSPNHISWSILIDTCGGLGNIEGAVQILNSMRKAGINPDVVAYTIAIKVCVKNKNLKLAFSLFTDMKRYQIQPNLVTYNTLLRARSRYGSLHEVQQCLAVYQDMRKAGFKSNDHYLKELIEEWCEGVIQNNNQNQRELTSSKGTNLRSQSLLLEKLAENLQKSNAENLAIDLRGLTKVEARIFVLAVLRMIKENHSLGIPVRDDLLIILGPNKVDVNPAESKDSEVKDAITKLLQNDLGLNVSLDGPIITIDKNVDMDKPFDSDPNSEEILGRKRLHMKFKSSTRRPAILQRLKVTKKSLHRWLQRRIGGTTR